MTNLDWMVAGVFVWLLLLLFVMSRCFSSHDREPLNDAIGELFVVACRIGAVLVAYGFLTLVG